MTWNEAIHRAIFYLFAHLLLALLVFGLVGLGIYLINQGALTDGPAQGFLGATMVLAGIVVVAIGGPAIWIKVIGDIVASTNQASHTFDHHSLDESASHHQAAASRLVIDHHYLDELPSYHKMALSRLVQEAESLGVIFSVNDRGRPSMRYFGNENPLPSSLREELHIRDDEVLGLLKSRLGN